MSSYMPEKRVNSYEASEGSLTLPIHILFHDISFYFVICVDVAVILYAIVLIALIQESILI